MKFLLYKGRHGEEILTEHTPEAWKALLAVRERDDQSSIEEARSEGFWVDGSEEYSDNAYISVDDGGQIDTIWLTEADRAGLV